MRQNALKHGFTAAEIILPTVEAEADFEAFRQAFLDKCQPVGPIEEVLVEDMVVSRWRLSRIRKMEPGFFAKKLQDVKDGSYPNLSGYAHLTRALSDDALYTDTYGKMSRYEGRFQRTFFKAFKELERLRALRAELSDYGNGTVLPTPDSPAPEPQTPPSPDAAKSEIQQLKSDLQGSEPPAGNIVSRVLTIFAGSLVWLQRLRYGVVTRRPCVSVPGAATSRHAQHAV